jgi:hypothetical protein
MLAAVTMTVLPAIPAQAAIVGEPRGKAASVSSDKSGQLIADHAARGNVAILSQAQMNRLAKSNPGLHRKLMTAYKAGTVPSLTPAEKQQVAGMTSRNLADYKAGTAAATGSLFMLWLIPLVILPLIIWEWHFSGQQPAAYRLFHDIPRTFHAR